MLREIIEIDEELCNGCGECVPGCPEGALQIIDGKARMVSDLMCDGLGACVGHCPTGALKVIKREAEPYNERKAMENIIRGGKNVIAAHLKHLKDHGETGYYEEALAVLRERDIPVPESGTEPQEAHHHSGGCPGSRMMSFAKGEEGSRGDTRSQLTQWPVQLHLVSPQAPYFRKADVLLAADCTAFAAGNFHEAYLKGRSLAIACPKLDEGGGIYVEKITELIDRAEINTLTVLVMEVPCCGGLVQMAKAAASSAKRRVPIKKIMLSLRGEKLSEEWI